MIRNSSETSVIWEVCEIKGRTTTTLDILTAFSKFSDTGEKLERRMAHWADQEVELCYLREA